MKRIIVLVALVLMIPGSRVAIAFVNPDGKPIPLITVTGSRIYQDTVYYMNGYYSGSVMASSTPSFDFGSTPSFDFGVMYAVGWWRGVAPILGGIVVRIIANRAAKKAFTDKIRKAIIKRGWTEKEVRKTIKDPFTTRKSKDKRTGGPATAFYKKDGSYVVVNNKTGEVIQVSGKGRNWAPDSEIINPYIPPPPMAFQPFLPNTSFSHFLGQGIGFSMPSVQGNYQIQ